MFVWRQQVVDITDRDDNTDLPQLLKGPTKNHCRLTLYPLVSATESLVLSIVMV